MCFPRKAGLGQYNTCRKDWLEAYRAARVSIGKGREPNPRDSGIVWKAQLIVVERNRPDHLTVPMKARLAAHRTICGPVSWQGVKLAYTISAQ